ncbi:MAG: DUF615 domain-containing protein [Gammaproteobacteria bacterium]|nr:DUF615 domain-containing protein [Gammaproteobacteria bacterium]
MKREEDEISIEGRPNKTQLKRETEALRELAQRLIALPSARLAKLPLDDELREELLAAQGFERGALARQLRYLTSLLRAADPALILRELDRVDQPRRDEARVFKQVEQWRDALVAGDDTVLDELAARFPEIDLDPARRLAADAREERALGKPSRSGRQLFRYLAGLLEAP